MSGATRPRKRALGVLFDLDGTLLDTAADFAAALNLMRAARGHGHLPLEQVRMHVSNGAPAVLRACLPGTTEAGIEAARRELLVHYRRDICVHTRLFPGHAALLDAIEARAIPWGIVTNKPGWLTEPILRRLGLLHRAGVVVSGDTLPERKPHPRPLLFAAERLGVDPADCAFVGDSWRDAQAARAAGMASILLRYGYLNPDDKPDSWPADAWLDQPMGLLDWLAPGTQAA
jgi:2-phosphoglycolate phosphatase